MTQVTKTAAEVEAMFATEATAKKAMRLEEFVAMTTGTFTQGRTPYIFVTKIGGTEIRLKFVDTIKKILNTKGQEVLGKESWLSYLEVTAMPAGAKPYFFTLDVTQSVWAPSKVKANEKRDAAMAKLKEFATKLGIDLSSETSWNHVYSQSY